MVRRHNIEEVRVWILVHVYASSHHDHVRLRGVGSIRLEHLPSREHRVLMCWENELMLAPLCMQSDATDEAK